MTLDAETLLGLAQVGLLGGIFYRMGAVRAEIESLRERVSKIEKGVKDGLFSETAS